jgi:hypothetical protein
MTDQDVLARVIGTRASTLRLISADKRRLIVRNHRPALESLVSGAGFDHRPRYRVQWTAAFRRAFSFQSAASGLGPSIS